MSSTSPNVPPVVAWRHPRPIGAEGRCIGRTNLPVDRRKAKRLAHRIRRAARLHGWPRVVRTSSLQRCAAVGRQLRHWGWRHHIDDSLIEMDFGAWEGLRWEQIAHAEVEVWCQDFAHHAPGGGESLHAMLQRVSGSLTRLSCWAEGPASAPLADLRSAEPRVSSASTPVLIIAHAGWILSARWVAGHTAAPAHAGEWPSAPRYGECCTWPEAPLQYRPVDPASRK